MLNFGVIVEETSLDGIVQDESWISLNGLPLRRRKNIF